ncbi:LysR substrate-binding domain-containing protein [Microbacterium allomyrinae]|uniref:Transcriptional regulator n=1 Tax=Microbacterium allomyrinae TaxID=2830666 RepID=A0A9X1LXZ4_9MICO|nr:LysR substrate-binding domain-containing protein [Microbacterium allomyrinae]MCC2033683.1 transcriptional regulator [Microbacterium allomyrinae]
MSKGGSSRGRTGKPRRDASATRSGGAKKSGAKPARAQRPTPRPSPGPSPVAESVEVPQAFTLGAIPGATPGKWIDVWKERMPLTALELIPLSFAEQRRALVDGDVEAALVRLPIDAEELHVIPLYDEVPVVVTSTESHLTAADDLALSDLAGEVVIVPQDDVLGLTVPGGVAASFAPPADTGEAVAIVAAGVGVVIVPMSLARLHHRKDAEYRVLRDAPVSTVALAWVAERTTPSVEAFVGIVRGRTANSSRG